VTSLEQAVRLARMVPRVVRIPIVDGESDDGPIEVMRCDTSVIGLTSDLSVRLVQAACAAAFRVAVHDIESDRRTLNVTRPRQVAMYLAKKLTLASLAEIGRAFHRDHTTVIYAIRRVEQLIEADAAFAAEVFWIESRLRFGARP